MVQKSNWLRHSKYDAKFLVCWQSIFRKVENLDMDRKPSYEELKQRVKELEKEAGERLRMERELLKLYHAVNHSPSAIMITDAHGLIESVGRR